MKYRTPSVVAGGGRAVGGADGMRPMNGGYVPMSNHGERDFVESDRRQTELLLLVQGCMQQIASELLVAVPPAKRSERERCFLSDVKRGRYEVTGEALARLLAIGARAASPFHVSEAFRRIENTLTPASAECPLEVSEAEQAIDAAADLAQLQAAREKSPVRYQQLAELAPKVIAVWRRLGDACQRKLARGVA